MKSKHPLIFSLLAVLAWLTQAGTAFAFEITPFATRNQSPLVQIFGLPAAGNAQILKPGKGEGMLAMDIASNFAHDETSSETILLDGETYRYTLAMRYGLMDKLEMGIEIPYVGQGGGIFDSFIEGWHDFFNLPEGGRKEAPRNRLLYSYEKDGKTKLKIDDSSYALGDISLTAGYQLYQDSSRAVALRSALKLPTGNPSGLHGSGSTDFALWLTAANDFRFPGKWGHLTIFGAAGGMAMTNGRVLADQQRNLAGFGSAGFGWAPTDWIALTMEVSGHTPFYQGSNLRELNKPAAQYLIGGTLAFGEKTFLDIAVGEDIAVYTAPDVSLFLALRRTF